MKNNIAIELKNISKIYKLYDRNLVDRFKDTFLPGKKRRYNELHALKNINLTIHKGEILGLIGRNGAGKTTLLKIISGITQPTTGEVRVKGKIVPLLELGAGFNPEFTGRENIYYSCSLQGMKKVVIDKLFKKIVDFAELDDFIDIPIKKYSSGMRARLGFAVSVHIDPDILILDEILSVGDELFRRKCFVKMEEFFKSGKTIIYVTHNSQNIIDICSRAALLHKSELLIEGYPKIIIGQYSQLLNCKNLKNEELKKIEAIKILNENQAIKLKHENNYKNKDLEKRLKQYQDVTELPGGKSFYADGFESKSTKVIKEKDITVFDYILTDLKGKKVNHIVPNNKYNFLFSVRFNEFVERIRLGCYLYNHKSINLAGCCYPDIFKSIEKVNSGDVYHFKSTFNALLRSGFYGIKIIIRGLLNDEERILVTILDGIVFRVIETGKDYNTGLANLFDNDFNIKKE